MFESEAERKARKANEEVERLKKVLERIRRGYVPRLYFRLKRKDRVTEYLERRLSDG